MANTTEAMKPAGSPSSYQPRPCPTYLASSEPPRETIPVVRRFHEALDEI